MSGHGSGSDRGHGGLGAYFVVFTALMVLTGVTLWAAELGVKRLDLLREMVPGAHTVALLTNPSDPGAVKEQRTMAAASAALGLELATLEAAGSGDIERAFERLPAGAVDALAVVGDSFLISRRDRIVWTASEL